MSRDTGTGGKTWYRIQNPDDVPSPALLVYPERVSENIRRMVSIAGDVSHLRPHIKTHKLAELIAPQLTAGITRFKAATIAESELLARCGAPDVLLALQPTGPNIHRLIQLIREYPATRFSTLVDDPETARNLSRTASNAGLSIPVFIDLDIGQHRTGIEPGPRAEALAALLHQLPGIEPAGLHAYDGHLHQTDPQARAKACEEAYAPVEQLRARLTTKGMAPRTIVAGGTPTFPIHARRQGVECSPGTCVLWDAGYAGMLPDLDFLIAAVLLTRVVSRPGPTRLCLDLGHKAVASEMPQPRVMFPDLPDAQIVAHNEEHLVIESRCGADRSVGDVLHAFPWHVCPTVALHSEIHAVRNERATERWTVTARSRRISI